MKHPGVCKATRILAIAILAAAAASAASAYQGPRLWATFELSSVAPNATGADVTFSFRLHNRGSDDVVVDRIVLANIADAENAFATFDGGALPAGGALGATAEATVPATVLESWRTGHAAALFVYTRNELGNVVRTRVDAAPSGESR